MNIVKLAIELKKRMGLLKRIKKRVPKDKLIIIAKAIFNSKIRYGIAAYLIPIFKREDVKMEKLSPHAKELQVVQNSMVRVILGLNRANHIKMKERPFKKESLQKRRRAIDLVKKNSVKRPQKDLKKQTSQNRPCQRDLKKETLPKRPYKKTLQKTFQERQISEVSTLLKRP